jgi:hypothetical protein
MATTGNLENLPEPPAEILEEACDHLRDILREKRVDFGFEF